MVLLVLNNALAYIKTLNTLGCKSGLHKEGWLGLFSGDAQRKNIIVLCTCSRSRWWNICSSIYALITRKLWLITLRRSAQVFSRIRMTRTYWCGVCGEHRSSYRRPCFGPLCMGDTWVGPGCRCHRWDSTHGMWRHPKCLKVDRRHVTSVGWQWFKGTWRRKECVTYDNSCVRCCDCFEYEQQQQQAATHVFQWSMGTVCVIALFLQTCAHALTCIIIVRQDCECYVRILAKICCQESLIWTYVVGLRRISASLWHYFL